MKRRVELRTHEVIDKKGRKTEWSWEEGPELREFIKRQAMTRLHDDIKLNKKVTDKKANVEHQS
mgnify:FL=1|tara:strand:- start:112 stop:303 length:192 start_codon:yes stop_codon:yes gene_type:complete